MPDRTFAAYVDWTLLAVDLSAIQEGKLNKLRRPSKRCAMCRICSYHNYILLLATQIRSQTFIKSDRARSSNILRRTQGEMHAGRQTPRFCIRTGRGTTQ